MDSSQAVFVENPIDVNIYDTKKYPFFFIAQRLSCVKVITVPMSDLLKLSSRIGDPKCSVGWILHMTRCGSTAVVQGLNAVPNCTVVSESQDLLVLLSEIAMKQNVNFNDYLTSSTFREILTFSVRFILKDFSKAEFACIKTTGSFSYCIVSLIADIFPDHKLVSMHRDGLATAKSMWRMCNAHVGLKTGLFVFNRLPTKLTKPLQKFLFVISNGLMLKLRVTFIMEN
ncbi:hypothetical protein EB796_004950 [Bugula neritina]|uniref:Uncharacterized protein n=1 Tax=Bugula neritina TaxID=10212 RepID=A0A7J7KDK5_BUGNE|nr:hypothetical protein EB796_004950 [Bugula neritina]